MTVPPLDRSTIWPYEDGEPGEFHYARYGNPTQSAAEAALGELEGGDALLFASGTGAATSVVLAFLRPGSTIALAEGALLRDVGALPRARGLGAALRRVRSDRGAAGRRRPGLARGAVEPVPDDARPRRGRPTSGARARRLDCLDARLSPRARARCRLRPALRDQVPHGPPRRARSGRLCAATPATRSACASYAAAPGIVAPPSRRGSSTAASPPSTSGCAATPRAQPRSPSGSPPTKPSSACATRASAGCSRSTSPAVPQRPRKVETGTARS